MMLIRTMPLSLMIFFMIFFAGASDVQKAHASPSMTVSPISGPVNTQITITIDGFTPSSTFFIRFDGADFPEWQGKADEKGSAVFSSSIHRFPLSVTKSSQKIPMAAGDHTIGAYAVGSNGKLLASARFVVDSKNPPTLTVTPSFGPVGTKVEVKGINIPQVTSPRLALKDGIERNSYKGLKKQSDGTWISSYIIPKEVVQGYDVSGNAIVIPIKAGEHSLMLYEGVEIVSTPFMVTEINTVPTPTPTPTPAPIPAPVPTPVQDANICNPDIPSYSQPGCKPKETTVTPIPAPSINKTCDPNIPRYAQEGCLDSAVSEKPTEKPIDQKPTCNPDIPSYSQIGCILSGNSKQSYTVSDGQAKLDEKKEFETTTIKYRQDGSVSSEIEPKGRRGRRYVADPASIEKDSQLADIEKKTQLIKDNRYDDILAELKELRNTVKEQATELKYLRGLTKDLETLKTEVKHVLTQFVTYGVDMNSQKLGAGERAAVLNSYKTAYNKLPDSDEEMSDMIKIVNGRFPSERSAEAEGDAIRSFKQIYKRIPNMKSNQNDVAAIMVMSYGLRQAAQNRNLVSEKKGIQTFKSIFGKTPQTSGEWNVMQAITYSGAARRADQDKDLLSDNDEKEFGTDPKNPDTDTDGSIDGLEIENYSNPLDSASDAVLDTVGWLLLMNPDIQSGSKNIQPSGGRKSGRGVRG